MNDTTTAAATSAHFVPQFVPQHWMTHPAADAYQEMFAREARDWSLLRLVAAAGLTVMALGVIVAVYP